MLTGDDLKEIIDIGIGLTMEKDEDSLLDNYLASAMKVAKCDAGNIYLYRNGELSVKIIKNHSRGMNRGVGGEILELPSISLTEQDACAYAANNRVVVNIANVYTDEQFDFSPIKRHDVQTNYHTRSMLIMPILDVEDQVLGVIQLKNAIGEDGMVTVFNEDQSYAVKAISYHAALSLCNIRNIGELKEQMYSFVDAFSTVADARSPFNGSHTKKVTRYAELLADEINKRYEQGSCKDYFDRSRREQLTMAATVHDIGKLIVPLSIMNKATRLEGHLEEIEKRFALIEAYYEVDFLKGIISNREYEQEKRFLKESLEAIREINTAVYVTSLQLDMVRKIANHTYNRHGGELIPYITDYERECLEIRRGTLTDSERQEMQNHVVMTDKILEKVHFNKCFSDVRKYAASHHELLDGSGYPKKLKGKDLDLETRILAVVDIYDALVSEDRPYKKPVTQEQAFGILGEMAREGKLEGRLVDYLKSALLMV